MLVEAFPHWTCQRNPGSAILPMDDQRSRIILFAIYKQDHHLTIAVIRSVVWARTVRVCQTGYLQVERLHDAKAGAGQLLADPNQNLVACLIEN
jgi:hypothetical protein